MNDILSNGFRLYAKYFRLILLLVLTIGLPCQLLASYFAYEVFGRKYVVQAFEVGALIELLVGVLMTGGILQALFVDSTGRQADFLECVTEAVKHWLQLCWTNFLLSCLVTMAAVLFFLPIGTWQLRIIFLFPAMLLAVRLSLATTIVMTEGEWGAAALRRSIRLTADKSWPIAGLLFLVYLPLQLAGLIGKSVLQNRPEIDSLLFTALFGTVIKLATCIVPVCFYYLYEKIIAEDRGED